MTETNKTVLFVFVAVVVGLVAWLARPRVAGFDEADSVINQPLFPEFKDPAVASSLELVQFDDQSGQPKPFKVTQVKKENQKGEGEWVIPSHQNYPADAKEHLAEAATALLGLTVLRVASQSMGDHEVYGVVDPMAKGLKPGAPGVGLRATMRDKGDNVLVDLIIGKEVPDRKELRYVRRTGQDPVYEVRLKTDKLSTNFGDWIEKDLLKLSTFDVKGAQIYDYSLDIVNASIVQRGQMALEYSSDDSKWKLAEDKAFQSGKWIDQKLADDEELNTQKLDDMKYALGDLKIVDVSRKPAALSANLRDAGTLKKDRASLESLMQRGFFPVKTERGTEELLSTEGEVRVVMKDGVVYLLRFGNIAGSASPSPKADEKGKDATQEEKDKSGGVNRYLFVMAEFNPDLIEKPKLEPIPPEPKPDEKKPEAKKEEPKKPEAKKEDAKKDEKPDPKAERERIEKENKKKEDEYKEKIKKGEDRVKELNARFADWYYVIADDVYKKIHLGRKDVVKKKEKKEEEKKAEEKAPANSPAELEQLKGAMPAPKTPAASSPAPAPAPATPPAEKAAAPAEKPAPPPAEKPAAAPPPAPAAEKPAAPAAEGKPPAEKPAAAPPPAKQEPAPAAKK